jgi:hypothetical protein
MLSMVIKDPEVDEFITSNYFKYNATCNLFYKMMDLQQKKMVPGFAFKY